MQYFMLSIVFVTTLFICFYVFPFEAVYAAILLIILFLVITYFCLKREAYYLRIVTLSVYISLLLNAVLNLHFYPNLLNYQAGNRMAEVVAEEKIPVDRIYKLGDAHTWSLDFYNQRPVNITSMADIGQKRNFWLYVNDAEIRQLQNKGFDWDRQYTRSHFRITRLNMKFLNPSTRKRTLSKMHLIHMY